MPCCINTLFLPSKYQTGFFSQFQHFFFYSLSLSSVSLLSLRLKSVHKHTLHQAGTVHNSFVFLMFSGELCKVQSSLIPLGEKSQLSRRGLSSWLFNLPSPLQTLHPDNRLDTWFNTMNLSKSKEGTHIIQPYFCSIFCLSSIFFKCWECHMTDLYMNGVTHNQNFHRTL